MIEDPRFSKVQYDPRFKKLSRKKTKVGVDERFSAVFTDKRFSSSSTAPIDKRGKLKSKSGNDNDTHGSRFYRLERGELANEVAKSKLESFSSDGEEEIGSDLSDSTTETDTDGDDNDDVELDDDDEALVEQVPVIDKETHRLAAVRMDWSRITAADLYMAFKPYAGEGGEVKSVAIYPTKAGAERIEREKTSAPDGIFDDEGGVDVEKLRAYEISKLSDYYAVVECDSSGTANRIYEALDGYEFGRSSNKFDLRFVPDQMEFKDIPKDVATQAPEDYHGIDFVTPSLQHANISCSWENDEDREKVVNRMFRRNFSEKQLDWLESMGLLASDDSESEEEEDSDGADVHLKKNKKTMYQSLIRSSDGSGEEDENNEALGMEIKFVPELEGLNEKILKRNSKAETVHEKYRRRRMEKKKAKETEGEKSSDDFFEDEASGEERKMIARGEQQSKEDRLRRKDTNMEASQLAELELLSIPDKEASNNPKGYKVDHKRVKGREGTEASRDAISAVTSDPRFAPFINNPLYALDPTDPQYKRLRPGGWHIADQQHKGHRETIAETESVASPGQELSKDEGSEPDTLSKENTELSFLVRCIKRKSKLVPSPCSVSMKAEKMVEPSSSSAQGKKRKHVSSSNSLKKLIKLF